ncbi:hypothetical protein GCM10009679_79390 [Saccharothrix algeriensis]
MFLVRNGMPTVQLNGEPTRDLPLTSEAVVISLKTRSCPAEMAVSQSLAALRWLQAQGCQQFYFKYCSTFDSTAQGNIGPVLDALLAELGETRTVISPALPVNGRTVYQGYLFVGEQLLNESGMRGTVAKLAMRQPFVLFKGLTFQKLCLPGAFRPGDHHNKMLRPGLCVVHASPQYL